MSVNHEIQKQICHNFFPEILHDSKYFVSRILPITYMNHKTKMIMSVALSMELLRVLKISPAFRGEMLKNSHQERERERERDKKIIPTHVTKPD